MIACDKRGHMRARGISRGHEMMQYSSEVAPAAATAKPRPAWSALISAALDSWTSSLSGGGGLRSASICASESLMSWRISTAEGSRSAMAARRNLRIPRVK